MAYRGCGDIPLVSTVKYEPLADIPTVPTVAYAPLGDLPTVPGVEYVPAHDVRIPAVPTVRYQLSTDPGVTFSSSSSSGEISPAVWIGGAAVLGLIAWAVYSQMQIQKAIVAKEGSSGLLKYELGSAAIGVGARAADRLTSNKRRGRHGRRRRR